MDLPLSIFGLLYVALVAIAAVIGVFNIALILRYGMRKGNAAIGIVIFLAAFAIIVTGTLFAASGIDWSSSITFSIPGISDRVQTP